MIWEDRAKEVFSLLEDDWVEEIWLECSSCQHRIEVDEEELHCPSCGEPNENELLGKDRHE